MDEAKNDVDADITLDSLAPPTYQGRALQWSGEDGAGRVPELGEAVRWEEGPVGIVVGYFQGHGCLGVKLRSYTGEVVCLFGAEIDGSGSTALVGGIPTTAHGSTKRAAAS